MIDLTRLLPKLLRANGGSELAVRLAWARAAGPHLRGNAIPLNLAEGVLSVAVADAIWQKQLQQMSAELISRVNNLLGQHVVNSLIFRIDPKTISAAQPAPQTRERKTREIKAPPQILFAAGAIADEELRGKFIRAAGNCVARRDAMGERDAPKV